MKAVRKLTLQTKKSRKTIVYQKVNCTTLLIFMHFVRLSSNKDWINNFNQGWRTSLESYRLWAGIVSFVAKQYYYQRHQASRRWIGGKRWITKDFRCITRKTSETMPFGFSFHSVINDKCYRTWWHCRINEWNWNV